MLIIALYNSPHKSPMEFNGSSSSYKRAFSSSSSVPNKTNNFMSSQPLPRDITTGVLDRLITRRPAQRIDAREFQQAQYFDNILVSTIRFLDSFPAKTPNEKSNSCEACHGFLTSSQSQFLIRKFCRLYWKKRKTENFLLLYFRVSSRSSVCCQLGSVLLRESYSKIERNVLDSPCSKRKRGSPRRDSLKEAGLMVVLENIQVAADNSSEKSSRMIFANHQLCPRISDSLAGRCCSSDVTCRSTNSRFLDSEERTLPRNSCHLRQN